MQWVTRERPKVDRLACPWLISRFIDDDPEFLFVPAGEVRSVATRFGGIPFDVPGVELSPAAGRCSFDAFLAKYRLDDPALSRLAGIVRAADRDQPSPLPEAAGLRAISFGLSSAIRDDRALLAQGLVLYDGLYKWVRKLAPGAAAVRPHEPWLWRWIARSRERQALADLNDHLLRDVGLTRSQVDLEANKPFWTE